MKLAKFWKWYLKESNSQLGYFGLDEFVKGSPIVLYHGTTTSFSSFDIDKSRKNLVDKYTGIGIFLTPSKKIAWKYAMSSRNKGLPVGVIDDVKKANPHAGEFLEMLYKHGQRGWELFWKEKGFLRDNPGEGAGELDTEAFRAYLNVDANSLMDVATFIEGSSYEASGSEESSLLDLFSGTPQGAPDWLFDELDSLGVDSTKYKPKVYKVSTQASHVLVTGDKEEAKRAFSLGYDAFVFMGEDLVDGVPEVAIRDGSQVNILDVEVDS